MSETDQGNVPYCSNCGYQLTGLTESSKCPECGRPLVEILTRGSLLGKIGRRYRSPVSIFGLPLVHVALGPSGNELRGRAKGIIAVGDVATGVLAIGGMARGVIAVGGLAIGLIGFGGLAIGLIACTGGLAVGGLACGGGAVGIVAQGGGAVGVIADGGGTYGYLARGGKPRGTYTIQGIRGSPAAKQLMAKWGWLIGQRPGTPKLMLSVAVAGVLVAAISVLIVWVGYLVGGARVQGRPEAQQQREFQ